MLFQQPRGCDCNITDSCNKHEHFICTTIGQFAHKRDERTQFVGDDSLEGKHLHSQQRLQKVRRISHQTFWRVEFMREIFLDLVSTKLIVHGSLQSTKFHRAKCWTSAN